MKYNEDVEFKDKFVERYSKLTDFEKFREYSLKRLRRSVRVNTIKTSVEKIRKRLSRHWKLEPVPWCKEGFFIESRGQGDDARRDVGNLPEHMLGYIYIQEAASMIPPIVLGPKPGERVLDLCASPGSKATQIAMYMKNQGTLVANDYKYDRIKALGINIQRMGVLNCAITLMQGQAFKGAEFDRILVDAPCSGTGTIAKSHKTIKIWNPNMVKRLAGEQKSLISRGFEMLRPGGTMVYSTCSCEPEENEGVVSSLLERYEDSECIDIKMDINQSKPVMEFEGSEYNSGVSKTLRIWPQDNDTEGFFVAKIRRLL